MSGDDIYKWLHPRSDSELEEIYAKVSHDGKPPAGLGSSYEESIVSFIDLLGFGNIIKSWQASTIASVLACFYGTNKQLQRENNVQTLCFSDSVVRVCGFIQDPSSISSQVLGEIHALAAIQFELACYNALFLRGGCTCGQIRCSDAMIFGPAFVDAYNLESKVAVFPRILVDLSIVDALTPRERQLLGHYLMLDGESNLFIDYLGAMIKGADVSFLDAHKHAILGQYHNQTDERVKQKYAWLKEYHNFSIASGFDFEEAGVTPDNLPYLSISDEQIPRPLTPPSFMHVFGAPGDDNGHSELLSTLHALRK